MGAFAAGILRRTVAVIAAAVLAGLVLMPGSARADEEMPEDVAAAFSDEGVQALRRLNAEAQDSSEIAGFGMPRQIHLWSESLLRTGSAENPTVAIEEWVAPALDADGKAVGLYRVWRPSDDAPAEFAGYAPDAESAAAIHGMAASATLIDDPPIAGWFSLEDGRLTALNEHAEADVPHPAALESVAPIISERHDEMVRQAAAVDDLAAGTRVLDARGISILLTVATLVAVAAVTLHVRRRARSRS